MTKPSKKHLPQVSVVLTTYYRRPVQLSRSIESILNQTLIDFEFIIVNDGAPDDTKRILNNYAKQDSRIKVLHQQNKGLGQARNLGVHHARAPYIAFMDDDDRSLPRRLEEQLNFLRQHPQFTACVCYVYSIEVTPKGIQRRRLSKRRRDGLALNKERLKNVSKVSFSLSPMTMITKEAFGACGGYRSLFQVMEDLDFTLRFQEKFRVGVVAKPLYEYTKAEGNFCKNMTTTKPVQNLKYVLACYISAWYRRNTLKDPVEQSVGLDEVVHKGAQLPKSVRFHILYKCSTHPIKVFLANPDLSIADVFKLFTVLRAFDDAGDLRFLCCRGMRLVVILARQRKILAILNLIGYGIKRSILRIAKKTQVSIEKDKTSI